jgi:hypothetical protein
MHLIHVYEIYAAAVHILEMHVWEMHVLCSAGARIVTDGTAEAVHPLFINRKPGLQLVGMYT